MEEDRLSNLPLELQANILSRLSTKHIFHIKCLSKSWKSQLRSSDFIKEYVRHCQALNCNSNEDDDDSLSSSSSFILIGKSSSTFYSYDFNVGFCKKLSPPPRNFPSETKLVGSCNGVLCFQRQTETHHGRQFSLYNSETGTYMGVPTLIARKERSVSKPSLVTYYEKIDAGFGYDSMDQDYKIFALVRITTLDLEFETSIGAYMYSLKSNSWKKINNLPSLRWNSEMTYCNNALHWVTYAEDQTTVVSAFSLGIEDYYTIQLPKEGKFMVCYTNLVHLKGYLHVVDLTPCDMNTRIWIMKEYGVTKSWTTLVQFKIPVSSKESWRFQPLPCAYSKDGKQILVALEVHPINFVDYDVQSRKVKGQLQLDSQFLREGIVVVPWAGSVARDPLVPTAMMQQITRLLFWCKRLFCFP